MRWFAVLIAWLSLLFLADRASAFTYRSESLSIHPRITAQLRLPEQATPKTPVPLLLVFGGFQNAGRVLDLVQPSVPLAMASFDYPFEPPRKFSFPGSLRHAPQIKAMVADTIEGIVALRAALAKRPEIRAEKTLLVGASLGAPFALAAAARDEGFGALAIVHGFGRVPETAQAQLIRSLGPRLGWAAEPVAWLISRIGWWYLDAPAPERVGRELKSPQKVLVITADQDSFISPEARESLWRSISESGAQAHLIRMPGDHLQPGSDALIAQILKMIESWALDNYLI